MNFSILNNPTPTSFDTLNSNTITASTISSNAFLSPFQFQSFPQNTADVTSITGLTGSGKWSGGVLAPNGKIYGIPFDSTSVLIIDPVTNTIDTTSITGLSGSNKWIGGVLAPNGKIYGIPYNSTSVLIIDPITNRADTTTIFTGFGNNNNWAGGVLASNGKIYGIPHSSTSVLIIDPNTNTADTTTITGLTGTNKWVGGVLGLNGKIYGIPWRSTSVLIIDPLATPNPTADTATISGLDSSNFKWSGGVLAPDGKIYGMPHSNTTVLIIDPTVTPNTANTTTITGLTGSGKWYGGSLAPNGKIYGLPSGSTSVLIIDPVVNISALYGINLTTASYNDGTKTLSCGTSLTSGLIVGDIIIVSTATNTYVGSIATLNNTSITFVNALGVSISAPNITKIERTRADTTAITGLSSSTDKWNGGVLAPNGKIYGIPRDSTSAIQIITGFPTLPPWMLQAYFNKF
jgi:phage shock protein PspC (stress-responsive transcriptional regulator)